jgi:hypothetical protein
MGLLRRRLGLYIWALIAISFFFIFYFLNNLFLFWVLIRHGYNTLGPTPGGLQARGMN